MRPEGSASDRELRASDGVKNVLVEVDDSVLHRRVDGAAVVEAGSRQSGPAGVHHQEVRGEEPETRPDAAYGRREVTVGQNRQTWCASDDWSVGALSGSGIDGRIVKVTRWTPAFEAMYCRRGVLSGMRHGEAHGMTVPLGEAGDAEYDRILAEKGYLTPFYRKAFWTREQFEKRATARGRA